MLEMLNPEQISQLADVLEVKTFAKDDNIIQQGEEGKEFFILETGECRVTIETGTRSESIDVQEHRRYHPGDLFGELAVIKNAKRAATVQAVSNVEVMCLSRRKFMRMLGPLDMLQETSYLRDPRKSIADFYQAGNLQGPRGSLKL